MNQNLTLFMRINPIFKIYCMKCILPMYATEITNTKDIKSADLQKNINDLKKESDNFISNFVFKDIKTKKIRRKKSKCSVFCSSFFDTLEVCSEVIGLLLECFI